jgi:hypothetical protein
MKTQILLRSLTALVLPAITLGIVAVGPPANGEDLQISRGAAAKKPVQSDKKVDTFKARLEGDGFIVQEGKLLLAPLPYECCKVEPPLPCTFFNQASPYQAVYLPPSPHQAAGITEVPYLRYPPPDDNLAAAWRLQPDEAVVFVGLTPPPVRYLGFQTYLFLTVLEDGTRGRRWNNFGDQTNQFTINTAGTPNGTKGDPFNSPTIRITAADRGIDARVREAARRAGYPPSIMNTEPMPQSLLRMGVDENADFFSYILRAALAEPGYQDDLDAYKADPFVKIFRVTPRTPPPVYPATSPDPFSIPEFRIHGTGQTEWDLTPAVRELHKEILSKYRNVDPEPREFESEQWLLYGLHHMAMDNDGLGPSTDALYLRTKESFGTLGDKDFVIVYGVNHHLTGKAMYMNVTLYGTTKQIAADDVDDRQLEGSAAYFLPEDSPLRNDPDVDKLYVYKFARHCNGEDYCFEVPEGCCGDINPDWDTWDEQGLGGLKVDEDGFIAWRNYLDPVSKTGPDTAEVILDRAIKFTEP